MTIRGHEMTTRHYTQAQAGLDLSLRFWRRRTHIIMHHGGKFDASKGALYWWRVFFEWHAAGENEDKRPWGDIGYHHGIGIEVIDGEEVVVVLDGCQGGDLAEGAHTLWFNNAIGWVVVKDLTNEEVAGDLWTVLVDELAKSCIEWNIDPLGKSWINGYYVWNIAAHRDYNKTDCPGDAFYAQMDDLRVAVDERKRELERSD